MDGWVGAGGQVGTPLSEVEGGFEDGGDDWTVSGRAHRSLDGHEEHCPRASHQRVASAMYIGDNLEKGGEIVRKSGARLVGVKVGDADPFEERRGINQL